MGVTNSMVDWPEIRCQRGHTDHATKPVYIEVGGPTPYRDLSDVPVRFKRDFELVIYDWRKYRGHVGVYCPAADCVSETIDTLGVWEPNGTTLALSVLTAAPAGRVLDIGSQVGWYTALALACGHDVTAVDAEAENLRVLGQTLDRNGWRTRCELLHARIGVDEVSLLDDDEHAVLAKVDVEGAEREALLALGPAILEKRVDRILMEVSPVFRDGYGDLIADLVAVGYECFVVPGKADPPWPLDDLPADLERWRLAGPRALIVDAIDSVPQQDVLLALPGVAWG